MGSIQRRGVALFVAALMVFASIVVGGGVAGASTPGVTLTSLTPSTANTGTGAFSIPVGSIPAQAFHSNDPNNPGPIQSIGVGHLGVGHIGVGHIGVGHLGVGHIGVGHIGVGHLALVDSALRNILLSDLPITYPHGCDAPASTTPCTGWDGVLAGTGLEFVPRQNVTLRDVVADATALARFNTLELGDINLASTPLANLPFAAVALAGIPISQLPLDRSHADQAVQQWCTLLATPAIGLNCLSDLGLDPANPQPSDDQITLLTLGLVGVDFSQLPLDQLVVTGDPTTPNNVLGPSPLGATTLDDVSLDAAGVGHIGVGHLGVGHIGVGHLGVGHIGVGHLDINQLGVGHIGVGHLDVNAAGVGHIGVGHIGVGHLGVGHIGVGHLSLADTAGAPLGVGHIGVGHLDLAAAGLAGILLSDLTPTGLTHVVVCGGAFDCTVAGATLGDAATAGALQPGATLYDLSLAIDPASASYATFNATQIGTIIAALQPGSPELDTITLAQLIGQVTPQSLLDDPQFLTTIDDLFANGDQTNASATVAAGGIDASSTTLNVTGATGWPGTPFTAFVDNELVQVTAVTDNGGGSQAWTVTRGFNGSIVSAHDAGTPVFGGVDVALSVLLNGLTLDQQNVATLDQLLASLPADVRGATTFGELLSVLASDLGITVEDLLLAVIGQTDLPWQQLDLGSVQLQPYASPQATPITYTGSLNVTDDGNGSLQDVVVTATIPPDFLYVAGSATFDGLPIADPSTGVSDSGPVLTWTIPQVAGGAHTLTFRLLPGLSLGTSTVSGEAHLRGGTAGTRVSANVTVNDPAASDPNSPRTMQPDTLYLGHITPGANSDFYRLHVDGGQRVSLFLGNLPADFDLVFYALPGADHLRGSNSGSVLPVNDPPPSLTPANESLPPETLNDLPLVAGQRVYDVSASRGFHDEEIDTGTLAGGDYLVQVAGYDGSTSSLPYSLRARLTNDTAATCPGTKSFAFPTDTPTSFSPSAPASPADTIVLIDPARLAKTYGAALAQPLFDELGTWAANYGKAQIVDVEADAATARAYTAWDGDPCSVAGANGVVKAIGAQLDALLAANSSIRFLTIVGADDQIPMARLRDATRSANERGRSIDFAGQTDELTSTFSGGFLLSDDVYAQQHPLAVGGRDFYVPDLHTGRLLETPAEMTKAFSDFDHAHGVLPSSSTSLTTGYDFLKDGATAIAGSLSGGGHATNTTNPVPTLINDTWTRDDIAKQLMGADSAGGASDTANNIPSIVSLNAHFDEQNLLPAIGNATHDQSALFNVADARAAGLRAGAQTLQGTVLFSMGCHSGLNLPDTIGLTGNTDDWAQFMADQGAIWIANTGYGYGDTDTVALSEKLMADLADQLDHSGTIGEAFTAAKQRYAASLAVVSPYDEKVEQESTFYGLPQWSLPSPTTPGTPLPRPGATSPAEVNGGTLRAANFSTTLTDGGTSSAGPNTLTLVQPPGDASTLDGEYRINGQTQTAPRRPTQPRYEVDVSPGSTDASNGYVAKGALITTLHSKDVAGFLPNYPGAAVDLGTNEQNPPVGDAPFPAGIQTVTTYGHGANLTQHLVVVPGQFRPTPGLQQPGRGTERLFTQFTAHVYYGPANDPDNVAPTILSSNAGVSGQTVTITANVTDTGTGSGGVQRVVALVTQAGSSAGTWTLVELHPSASLTDPPGTWVGTAPLPVAGNPVDFYLQAVDASGNVGTTSSKGAYFNAQNLAASGPLRFTLSGTPGANGWFRSAVTVRITAPTLTSGLPISYSIDGGAFTAGAVGPITFQFTDTTEAVHNVVAHQAGQQDSRIQVLIDQRAPIPLIGSPNGPAFNNGSWYSDNGHVVSVVPLDQGTFGSGVDTVTYSASGANTIGQKTVDEPPVGSPPIEETLANDGVTTFVVSAKDRAGNIAAAGHFALGVDSSSPTASISANPAQNANGWHNSVPEVTLTADDASPSSGLTSIGYTVNGTQRTITGTAPVTVSEGATPGAAHLSGDVDSSLLGEGRNDITFQAFDGAGRSSTLQRVVVNVDLTPPSTTASVSPPESNGWEKVNTAVTFTGSDPHLADGTNGSGVVKVTYSATKDATKGGAVVSSTDVADTAATYTLTTEGITTFTYFSTDAAGNVETTPKTRVVRLDKTPPVISLSLTASNANSPVGPQAVDTGGSGAPIPVYLLGQAASATFGCTDPMSGVASCVGTNDASNTATSTLLTNALGMHTYTVAARDVAGNVSNKTFKYRVVYNLCLDYDPTKAANIGSAFPIKLRLCNAAGANLSTPSITLTGMAADNNGALISPNQAGNTGNNFAFVKQTTDYQYNLKTDSRFMKTPNKNWLNFRVSTDPATPTGNVADQNYLNLLYRAYFLLK